MGARCPAAVASCVLALALGGGRAAGPSPAGAAALPPEAASPPEESFVLPPYLESVVLDVSAEDGDEEVEILAPAAGGARPLVPGRQGVEEVRLGRSLRTLVVEHPAAGRWRVRRSRPGTLVEVRGWRFMARGKLLAPGPAVRPRRGDRVLLRYQVTDERGAPLEELAEYPLACEVVLVEPGGRRVPMIMDRESPRQLAVFRARRGAACNLPGRYWTEVALTVEDLAGRKVAVLQDRWSGFWVTGRRR